MLDCSVQVPNSALKTPDKGTKMVVTLGEPVTPISAKKTTLKLVVPDNPCETPTKISKTPNKGTKKNTLLVAEPVTPEVTTNKTLELGEPVTPDLTPTPDKRTKKSAKVGKPLKQNPPSTTNSKKKGVKNQFRLNALQVALSLAEDNSVSHNDEGESGEFTDKTASMSTSIDVSNHTRSSRYRDTSQHTTSSALGDISELSLPEISQRSGRTSQTRERKVSFNYGVLVKKTLHINNFTKEEVDQSWYSESEQDDIMQLAKLIASSETPRDTQTRMRRQRTEKSKKLDTRGLERWTPSGYQRYRYITEAAFLAVWDEQLKQRDRDDGIYYGDPAVVAEDQETLRKAYERVSKKSLKEAHLRAKEDEEIASRLRLRRRKTLNISITGRKQSTFASITFCARRLFHGVFKKMLCGWREGHFWDKSPPVHDTRDDVSSLLSKSEDSSIKSL